MQRPGRRVVLAVRLADHLDELIEDGAGAGGVDLAARGRAGPERVDEGVEDALGVFAKGLADRAVERADHVLVREPALAPLLGQPVGDRLAQVGRVLRRPALELPLGEPPGGGGEHLRPRPRQAEQAERLADRDGRGVRVAVHVADLVGDAAGRSQEFVEQAPGRSRRRAAWSFGLVFGGNGSTATRANGGSGSMTGASDLSNDVW